MKHIDKMHWIYVFEITWVLNFQKLWPFWTTNKIKYKVHCLVFYFAIVFSSCMPFMPDLFLAFKFSLKLNLSTTPIKMSSDVIDPALNNEHICSNVGTSQDCLKNQGKKKDFQNFGPNMTIVFHVHANSFLGAFLSERIEVCFLLFWLFSLVSLVYFWRPTM